jgi:hypothetical protein
VHEGEEDGRLKRKYGRDSVTKKTLKHPEAQRKELMPDPSTFMPEEVRRHVGRGTAEAAEDPFPLFSHAP